MSNLVNLTDRECHLLALPPADWQGAADALSESGRAEMCRRMEGIAYRATMLARYLDGRSGPVGGDQGHNKAMRAANRAGRIVWCQAFGYNQHDDLTV